MQYFYSHLIEIESIIVKMDELDLSDDQKKHLAYLLDSTIHQTVLDLILSKLPEEDRIVLMEKMKENSQDKKILEFLSEKVENIEDEIRGVVEKLKEELYEDIKQAKGGGYF